MAIRLQVCASLLSLPFARVAAVQRRQDCGCGAAVRVRVCVCIRIHLRVHTHLYPRMHTRVCLWHRWWTRTAQQAWLKAEYLPPQVLPEHRSLPASRTAAVLSGRAGTRGGERCLSLSCAVTSSLKKVLVENCPQQSRRSFVSRGTELQAAVAADFCSNSPDRLTSPCHLSLPDVILRALAGRGYTERGDTQ